MNTADRLRRYYPFDEDIAAAVSDAAAAQKEKSFRELADAYKIDERTRIVTPAGTRKPVEVLTLTPAGDFDESHARVFHNSVATGINPNVIMRAIRLFAADPSQQLIVAANPSAPGHGAGKVPLARAVEMYRTGTFRPMAAPLLTYLSGQKITTADEIGASFGADKAAATAEAAPDFGIHTPHGVFIEAVSARRRHPSKLRSIIDLGQAFMSTEEHLQQYIDQSEWPGYSEVRSQEKLLAFGAGLLRATNLAGVAALAVGGFEGRVRGGMDSQSGMHAAVIWGTDSELVHDPSMLRVVDSLTASYGEDRVGGIRLTGMHHTGENDADLIAAAALQGLRV